MLIANKIFSNLPFKRASLFIFKTFSDVKMMSKGLGTIGIGGMEGKPGVKCPLFGTVGNAETNLLAEGGEL